MYEQECEAAGNCDTDQQSFKAYLARWIAAAIVKAPFTYDSLKPILEASATAAAATCTGGTNGTSCGMKWRSTDCGKYLCLHFSDGVHFGEEMVLDGHNNGNNTGGFMLDSSARVIPSDGHKTMIPRVIWPSKNAAFCVIP